MSETKFSSSLGHWWSVHPQTAGVYEMLRIDYCCGGDQSLEESCWKNGLEVLQVRSHLQRVIAGIYEESNDDWLHTSLTSPCDYIQQTHHLYLESELCRLTYLIAKVIGVHRNSLIRQRGTSSDPAQYQEFL